MSPIHKTNGREVSEEVIVEETVSKGLLDYKEKKSIEAERRKVNNRFKKVEELIESNDRKLDELNKEYADPSISSNYARLTEISNSIEEINNEQESLMEEWEELQIVIEEYENG